jgi:hypothetical protein
MLTPSIPDPKNPFDQPVLAWANGKPFRAPLFRISVRIKRTRSRTLVLGLSVGRKF